MAVAQAERDRARAELAAAERESAALVARARASSRRHPNASGATGSSSRPPIASRDCRSQAYVEGAYPLTTVLEAQRNARDTLADLIDDLVAANTAAAALRLYTGVTAK